MIAACRDDLMRMDRPGFGYTRTPIHGLTFHVVRSSMIAAPRDDAVRMGRLGLGYTRTPIHGLTFHNSGFVRSVQSPGF